MKDLLRRHGRAVLQLLLIASVAGSLSCGDDQGPATGDGTILIGARTTGTDQDQDGYLVSVDDGIGQSIGLLDTIWVDALQPAEYEITLGGIAENCSVPDDENPQEATVISGDTVEVLFDITCAPAGGPGGPPPF